MQFPWLFRLARALAFLVVLAAAGLARADDGGGARGSHGDNESGGTEAEDDDHDLARDLVTGGKIRPLREIVQAVAAVEPGTVVGIRLKQKGSQWIYDIRLVTDAGIRKTVYIDAATAAILEVRQQ